MNHKMWPALLMAWTVTQVHSESTTTPHPPITHWDVPEGRPVSLFCPLWHEKDSTSTTADTVFWFLPNGTEVLARTENEEMWVNQTLIFKKATPEQSGEYVCVTKRQSSYESAIITLSVTPKPIPLTAWEENEPRLIRGGIASGVLMFLFTSLCLIYKFRWKKQKTSPETPECTKRGDIPSNVQVDGRIPSGSARKASQNFTPSGSVDVQEEQVSNHAVKELETTEQGTLSPVEVDGGTHPTSSEKQVSPNELTPVQPRRPQTPEIQVQYAAERQLSTAIELDEELPPPYSKEHEDLDASKGLPNVHQQQQQESNSPPIQVHYAHETEVSNSLEHSGEISPEPSRELVVDPHDAATSSKWQPNVADTGF